MKGGKIRSALMLIIVGCLFAGNLTIVASSNTFVESPENKVEVISNEQTVSNPSSNPSLLACTVGVGIADDGLLITFDTDATDTADEIGVKNVVLKEKIFPGIWKEIPMSNYYTNNADWYSVDVVYTGAKKGTTYCVECTHYAKYGSKELTLKNTSAELTYN